jgi:hypothetical protein
MTEETDGITLDTRLVPNPDFFLRDEGSEGGLLVDPNTGAVRLLNGPAAAIWRLIDGRRSLAEIWSALRGTFDGLPEAEDDLLTTARIFYRCGAAGLPGTTR